MKWFVGSIAKKRGVLPWEDANSTGRNQPWRPSRTWGSSGTAAVGSFGTPLGSGMVLFECAVHHRGSNLQHEMSPTGRPPHLLVSAHPAMQQPLHRAFGTCRRDRLS